MADDRKHVLNYWSSGVTQGTPNKPADLMNGEIALNIRAGYESLMLKNTDDKIIVAKIAPYDKELDENSDNAVENQAIAKFYNELKSQLDGVAQNFNVCGFARVNGETSPDATIFFGGKGNEDDYKENLKQITQHFNLGLVQDGKLYKRCANGRIDLAVDGTELLIDGSDGDVMIYSDCDIYFLKATISATDAGYTSIGSNNNVNDLYINIIALGTSPFTIHGINAKKFEPFAYCPQSAVKIKLDASNNTNGIVDKRDCYHSIYNKKVRGNYYSPASSSSSYVFNESYSDGYGYVQTVQNAMDSIWYGQCKNDDEKTNFPYMGGYYELYEILVSLIMMELKSTYTTDPNKFGCGCTLLTTPSENDFKGMNYSGTSGIAIYKENSAKPERIFNLMAQEEWIKSGSPWTTGVTTYALGAICSSYYTFTEQLEPQRILNDVAKAGLINKIWHEGGYNCLFEYDENGKMTISSVGIGSGMTPNKKYYQIRDVPGIDGMADGCMTAVINVFIRFTFNEDALIYKGSGSKKDYANYEKYPNGYAIFKFSYPVYKGLTWFNGFFTHLQGINYMHINDGTPGGSENVWKSKIYFHDNIKNVPPQTANTVSYFGNVGEDPEFVKGMKSRDLDWSHTSFWVGEADYTTSLFAYTYSGGTSNQRESAYIWHYASWGNGDSGTLEDNGSPRPGRQCVNASAVGCYAYSGDAGLRTLDANIAVGSRHSHYAGAFATRHLKL